MLVTIVAVLCGFVRFVALEGTGVLSVVVFFVLMLWPSLLALARCCRFRCAATKVRLVLLTVCLLFIAVAVGIQSFDLFIYPVVIVAAWPPQAIVIWIIRLDMRDLDRRRNGTSSRPNADQAAANTPQPQGGPPLGDAGRGKTVD